jgi:phosphonate transport system permease protein
VNIRRWALPLIIVAVAIWSWIGLDIDADRLDRASRALRLFGRQAWPPDFIEGRIIWDALLETIQIAALATIFGTIISVPLGLMAARNVFPPVLATAVRFLASAVRVLPSLIWALVAVIVVGPGPLAGVIAMTFYTIGYLAKLQSEAIEGIPRDALDAVRAMGAPRYQQAWHVVLPEAANALRSQALFMFEYNVRATSIIGFVGAGGLGVLIEASRGLFAYDRILAYLLVLFGTVVVIDYLSYLVRRRFIELQDAPRARFRDVFSARD